MMIDYDDDDTGTNDTWIAWQVNMHGAWTKAHRTHDHGRTTVCGTTVPTDVADTDGSSAHGRCKRCIDAEKGGR